MTPEPKRRSTARALAAVLLATALLCGGCSALADEFSWLDRAAPSTADPPDAPPSGLEARH